MKLLIRLIFIVTIATSCENKETQIQRFLLQGNEALKAQDYQSAEYYFQQAITLEPCFADALNNLGVLNFEQNHFDKALEYYNKTLECKATFLPAYFNRANAYYESKEYYNLYNDALYILKVKPDTTAALTLKGLAETKLKRFDEALGTFSKAIQQQPNEAEHFVNRGTVHYYMRTWPSAKEDFKRALQLQSNQPNALNALGMIASDQNNYDSARSYFEAALKLEPNQPYFLNNLGYTYLKQNNFEKAIELINQSITLDPDNAWAYRNKGIYYFIKNDLKNSIRLLKQALDMDDTVDKIHFHYGMALLKNGNKEEGCAQLKLAVTNLEQSNDEVAKLCK